MARKRTKDTAPGGADAEDGAPPTPKRLRLPLRTLDNVKVELARVYREARAGQIDPAVATKLAFLLSTLAKLIEGSDLEARIAAVEAAQVKESGRWAHAKH